MSLCYRCEHRARFFESGFRPRFECGAVDTSKYACYMYKPVAPCVLLADKNDDRPQFGPPMIASRSSFVRVAETELKVKEYEDGNVLYHEPV